MAGTTLKSPAPAPAPNEEQLPTRFATPFNPHKGPYMDFKISLSLISQLGHHYNQKKYARLNITSANFKRTWAVWNSLMAHRRMIHRRFLTNFCMGSLVGFQQPTMYTMDFHEAYALHLVDIGSGGDGIVLVVVVVVCFINVVIVLAT